MTAGGGGPYAVCMSLKSSSVSVTTTPVILATGTPGSGNVPKKVHIVPASAITIGGADAQTFPVTTAGVDLEVVSGDDVWAVSGGTVVVQVLEVSI